MLHLQVTRGIHNQRQEVFCGYSDHTRLFSFRGCARSKPQFLTAVPSLKLCHLPQFCECVLETLSSRSAVRNLEGRKRERFTPSHSLSDNCVFECIDHVQPNIPNSSHSTQLYIIEDNAAMIQMINKGRSSNLRHVTRTHRVDLDCLFGRVSLDHFILSKFVRTTINWRIF